MPIFILKCSDDGGIAQIRQLPFPGIDFCVNELLERPVLLRRVFLNTSHQSLGNPLQHTDRVVRPGNPPRANREEPVDEGVELRDVAIDLVPVQQLLKECCISSGGNERRMPKCSLVLRAVVLQRLLHERRRLGPPRRRPAPRA